MEGEKATKKTKDGEVKPRRTVLPPISGIRSSLETPPAPPKPAPPEKTAAPETSPIDVPDTVTVEKTAAQAATAWPPAEEQTATRNVVLIKPPIVFRQLPPELGLKLRQFVAERMND